MSQLEATSDSGNFPEGAAFNRPSGELFTGGGYSRAMDSVTRTDFNDMFSNSAGQQKLAASLPGVLYHGTQGDGNFYGKEQMLQPNNGPGSERRDTASHMGSSGYFSSGVPTAEGYCEPMRFSQLTPSTWPGLKPQFGNVAGVPSSLPNTSTIPPQWSAFLGRVSDKNSPAVSFDSSDPSGRDKLIYDLERVNHWLRSELELARKEIDRLRAHLAEYEKSKNNKQEQTKAQSRYWTPSEHQRFLEALRKFGHKDVKSISNYVGTRNPTQVRTHAQKYFLRLFKESRNRQEQGMGRSFSASRRSMSEPDLNRAELQNSSSQMYSQDNETSQKENDDSYASNLGSNGQSSEPKNGIRLLSLVATNESSSRCDGEGVHPSDERMTSEGNTS